MSTFICEKCGKLDDTALNNNYWMASVNKNMKRLGEKIHTYFKQEFSYYNDHVCCSDCCNRLQFSDGSGEIVMNEFDIKNKKHWSEYGKDILLEWESRGDGAMINAIEYFKNNGI